MAFPAEAAGEWAAEVAVPSSQVAQSPPTFGRAQGLVYAGRARGDGPRRATFRRAQRLVRAGTPRFRTLEPGVPDRLDAPPASYLGIQLLGTARWGLCASRLFTPRMRDMGGRPPHALRERDQL